MKLYLLSALFLISSIISLTYALPLTDATTLSVKSALRTSKIFALDAREQVADKGYEKFKKNTYKEPFSGGVYIVNGDTPISSESELREFYDREIVAEWKNIKFGIDLALDTTKLIVDAPRNEPAPWNNVTKKNLTYCISKAFGSRYDSVRQAITDATKAWESAADIRFFHLSNFDDKCEASTSEVVFDVRPVNVGGTYLARAFFPRYSRAQRNLLIDDSSFSLGKGKLQLVGILRHELGHALGYRHEHTRPEAGKCYNNEEWKPLTNYDAFSVMHYPQCNGLGDWSLTLTETDKLGAACLYGPANGLSLDPKKCMRI